jgi:hypothetical protein
MSITVGVLVLAVLGTVVLVAGTAWRRRAHAVRTAEAGFKLGQIVHGARAYFDADHFDAQGNPLPRCFPSNAGAPLVTHADMARGCCPRPCPAGPVWEADGGNGAGWHALAFALEDPHYFKYRFIGGCCRGTDCATAGFTAQAVGDLDCDGRLEVYERTGRVVGEEVVATPMRPLGGAAE